MEISRVKEQLARVGQSVEVAREMCERTMPGRVHAHLGDLNRDSTQLKYILANGQHDPRFSECVNHIKATGELIKNSCERLQHKDTRKALVQLHDELVVLEKYLQ